MAQRNIWELGEKIAYNPSIWTRVKHSSAGTSLRRSVKRSTGAKAVFKVGGFLLKQVPVPVIKDMLAVVSDAVHQKLRSMTKERKLKGATTNEKKAKWSWKDMDVQDVDRFRWKVTDAMRDFEKERHAFVQNVDKHAESGKICDAFVKVSTAFFYAHKRHDKLKKKIEALRAVCDVTDAWLSEVRTNLDDWARNSKDDLTKVFTDAQEGGHAECEKTVCVLGEKEKLRFKSAGGKALDGLGAGLSALSTALDPTEFISVSTPDDHQIKTKNLYTKKEY